jgi:cytochrome bd-type quinol oxidase subunit 1
MDLDPVTLSRIQFPFVVSFHIIFPAFTIGLAAWLATLEGMRMATGNQVYRRVFDFWLKVFAPSFGMGLVSGIVMAFQFGTNWSVLAERTGALIHSDFGGLYVCNFAQTPSTCVRMLSGAFLSRGWGKAMSPESK